MFSRTLLLFFVVSVIPKYTSYLTLFRYSTSTRNFLYSRLYNSAATITTESIAPTVYEKDLYSVLGVAKNSSKSELKQAYLQIVFQNHPDRNNSIDALAKFRNATYAYQVLGRDEKSRAIYDRKIDTQTYLTVLEEVGTDIIVPLAREVAVPLINFTFNSISSFAMPILRDVFEQSAAVAQIFAVGVEEDSLEVRMSRALDAFEKTSYDQNMRKLQTQLQQFDETIESTKTRFRDAEQTEKDGIEKQELLLEQFNAESLILDRLIRYVFLCSYFINSFYL